MRSASIHRCTLQLPRPPFSHGDLCLTCSAAAAAPFRSYCALVAVHVLCYAHNSVVGTIQPLPLLASGLYRGAVVRVQWICPHESAWKTRRHEQTGDKSVRLPEEEKSYILLYKCFHSRKRSETSHFLFLGQWFSFEAPSTLNSLALSSLLRRRRMDLKRKQRRRSGGS